MKKEEIIDLIKNYSEEVTETCDVCKGKKYLLEIDRFERWREKCKICNGTGLVTNIYKFKMEKHLK